MEIKELIRRKKQLHMTTAYLAELAGLPVSTVSKIMTGETKNPSYVTVEKIELVLFKEEQKKRVTNYYFAMSDYMNEHPEIDNDRKKFEEIYRKEHKLPNLPIEMALMHDWDSTGFSGSLALALNKPNDYITEEEYFKLEEDTSRVWLYRGQKIVDDAPTIRHQALSAELLFTIRNFIKENKGNCKVLPTVSLVSQTTIDTVFVPDLLVLCNQKNMAEDKCLAVPDWIIEITSKSTRNKDYKEKYHTYMLDGVKEYWIIDLQKERVVVNINDEVINTTIYSMDDEIPVGIYDGKLRIKISDIDTNQ